MLNCPCSNVSWTWKRVGEEGLYGSDWLKSSCCNWSCSNNTWISTVSDGIQGVPCSSEDAGGGAAQDAALDAVDPVDAGGNVARDADSDKDSDYEYVSTKYTLLV